MRAQYFSYSLHYKCRMCGQGFWITTPSGFRYGSAYQAVFNEYVGKTIAHTCSDHQCGIADLQGARKNNSEEVA